jgi:hypothetical protein
VIAMKLRLEGTAAECEQVACQLAGVVKVVSVSEPYPNRGRSQLVRVYIEVRLDAKGTPPATAEPEPDQPRRRVTLRHLARDLPPAR